MLLLSFRLGVFYSRAALAVYVLHFKTIQCLRWHWKCWWRGAVLQRIKIPFVLGFLALFWWHDLFHCPFHCFSLFLYLQCGLLHQSCSGDQLVMISTGLRSRQIVLGHLESLPNGAGYGKHQLLFEQQLLRLKTTRVALRWGGITCNSFLWAESSLRHLWGFQYT